MAKTVKITDRAYEKATEKSGEMSVKDWLSNLVVTHSNFGSNLDEEAVRMVMRDCLNDLRIDDRGNIRLD